MSFEYKSKHDFLALDIPKRIYYLARLYIKQDTTKSAKPFSQRLFICIGYLKKQPEQVLSVLYNYLSDHTHEGLMIWKVLPKAILYDQQRRREIKTQAEQAGFSIEMVDDILGGKND